MELMEVLERELPVARSTPLVVNLSTCVYRTWRGHCPQITPQTGDGFVAQFWPG